MHTSREFSIGKYTVLCLATEVGTGNGGRCIVFIGKLGDGLQAHWHDSTPDTFSSAELAMEWAEEYGRSWVRKQP